VRPCPVCAQPLVESPLSGQKVDRCDIGCGTFFDAGELEAISALARLFHAIDLDEPDIDTVPQREYDRVMACPADGQPMNPVDVTTVIMDVCGQCDGVWLDDGELCALRLAEHSIEENLQLYLRLGS
jgi:Zn-finger nucleic acid-binding protein